MNIPQEIRKELIGKLLEGKEIGFSERYLIAQLIEGSKEEKAPEAPKQVFYKSHRKSRIDWDGILEQAKKVVSKSQEPIRMVKLGRKCGIRKFGGTYVMFTEMVKRNFQVEKIKGENHVSEKGSIPSTKHEKPMLKKSSRSIFMSERTKQYMKSGIDYLSAARMANADYSKLCKGKTRVYVDFPVLDNVKEELIPILKDMLKYMWRNNSKISYSDIQYTLDINPGKYKDFVAELLMNSTQIAQSLGIDKTLVAKDNELHWI